MKSQMTIGEARFWANNKLSEDDLHVVRTLNGYWIDDYAKKMVAEYDDKSIKGRLVHYKNETINTISNTVKNIAAGIAASAG